MRVIVNATPLIALAVVNRLGLLHRMFDEVIVPTSVYQEVTQADERAGARLIAKITWLTVVSPQSQSNFEPLLLGLDAGETDVLLLAQEYQPDWVIIETTSTPHRVVNRPPANGYYRRPHFAVDP